MATTLETVADYISDVRTLLQDTIEPFRYDDDSLIVAFNVTLLEARRIRPDLFVYRHHGNVPSYTKPNSELVDMEPPFRLPLVFGTAAHALSRDQEDVQDQRSSSYMKTFNDMLLGLRVSPLQGGTPATKAKE